MAKKTKSPANVSKGAQQVTKDSTKAPKADRKPNGPRRSVVIMDNGTASTLNEFCAKHGLKMSTTYNRIRGLFAAKGTNALVIDASDPVFTADKSQNSAKCYAIFNNGMVSRCRVSEASVRDYNALITKKGVIVAGALTEYTPLAEYDEAMRQPAVEVEAAVEEVSAD